LPAVATTRLRKKAILVAGGPVIAGTTSAPLLVAVEKVIEFSD
jgi:hypothetical protein